MDEPNTKDSAKLVKAYNDDREAFEALYDAGCFPPLSKDIMARLRRGIGSFDEVVYYHQTKQGRADLAEQ